MSNIVVFPGEIVSDSNVIQPSVANKITFSLRLYKPVAKNKNIFDLRNNN